MGAITETQLFEMTDWARRWFWSFDNYLPIFRTAKRLQLRLIALNVDSEILSKVEVGGYAALSRDELKKYISDPVGFAAFGSTTAFKEYSSYVITPSYRMHQQLGILRNTITGQKLDEDMTFKNFFSGRILWDEGMAGAAAKWCEANPAGLMVGLVGSDHVKFGCGIPGCTRRLLGPTAVVKSVMLNPTAIDTNPNSKLTKE